MSKLKLYGLVFGVLAASYVPFHEIEAEETQRYGTFIECEYGDLEAVLRAQEAAGRALETILRYVDKPDARTRVLLQRWFGSDHPENRSEVGFVLGRSKAWLGSGLRFKCLYRNNGEGLAPLEDGHSGEVIGVQDRSDRLFAFIRLDDMRTIYLGLRFYEAASNGWDTTWGTIIHELTHFWISGSTDDHEYGRKHCLALAKSEPEKALQNADNYQYFVEEWVQGD